MAGLLLIFRPFAPICMTGADNSRYPQPLRPYDTQHNSAVARVRSSRYVPVFVRAVSVVKILQRGTS